MAGSDELHDEEKERRSTGCFVEPVMEKRGRFGGELEVEGLRVESRLFDADFFEDGVGQAYGWKGVPSIICSLRCKRCDGLPIPDQSLEELRRRKH